jgi:hypothetical protein
MSNAYNTIAFIPNGDGTAVMRAISEGDRVVAIELAYDRAALLGLTEHLLRCAGVTEALYSGGNLVVVGHE